MRGKNPLSRILNSLQSRKLEIHEKVRQIVPVSCDLSKPDFGLEPQMLNEMRDRVACIIHSAWAVNFSLKLKSFEAQHIRGLAHLIQFSLSVKLPRPAHVFFCSSISTGLAAPFSATIAESSIENLVHVSPTGYARSKFVGESIMRNAATHGGALTCVLRIGQVVGDKVTGEWSSTEAIPLVIRSGHLMGEMPRLDQVSCTVP